MKLRILIVLFVSSCSLFDKDTYQHEAVVVSEMRLLVDPPSATELEPVTVEELIQQLEQLDKSYVTEKRLTELRLAVFENQMEQGGAAQSNMPIDDLYGLFDKAQRDDHKAEIAYQIARLEDLSSNDRILEALNRVIETEPSTEARFRRAELLFIQNDYDLAELDYAWVGAIPGKLQLHALYMLSWSQFKQGNLGSALESAMDGFSLDSTAAHRDLKADLLRLTVIALDDAGGVSSLARMMQARGKPDWQTEVYRGLGDWYLGKRRFADSAETWTTYLNENPMHRQAPTIALQNMKTQKAAGFHQQILEQEQVFIDRYDRRSEFYAVHGDEVFEVYRSELKTMLDRLTQRRHSAMQSAESPTYSAVIAAYQAWLANFSDDTAAPRQRFLLAEVLEASGNPEAALAEYLQVAESDIPEAREAAYAVVLIYQLQLLNVEAAIAASQHFADQYPDDARASLARLYAAKQLFDLEQYAPALTAAKKARDMMLSAQDQTNAEVIIAHSAFQLEQFAEAESWYRLLLTRTGTDAQLKTNLLVSVFKQGEYAAEQMNFVLAVKLYRSMMDIDPQAALVKNAYYDVAGFLEKLDDKQAAIKQLLSYRSHYGDRKEMVSARLVSLYEEQGNLLLAAQELQAGATNAESKRLAQFRAAELYLQANQLERAIDHFRSYAHNYPQPVGLRLEAMHQMDELYQATNQPTKRAYWLRKKRDTVRDLAEAERSERAVFLAADASYFLAELTFAQFQRQKLSLPLVKSLKKKQALLTKSLAAYSTTKGFGSYDYTAKSNFRIASLYERLATDLLASERPANLNSLEKSQYELLLEEQAFPFEEQAIQLHQQNLQLGWQSGWSAAIDQSLKRLQVLSPARFVRQEAEVVYASSS